MDLRQAAQQALEALEWVWGGEPLTGKELDAITALRAALAEPEQEPVAWMQEMPVSGNEERSVRMTTVKMVADEWGNPIPLYTALTPRKPQTTHWEGCEAVHPECKTEPLAAWENKYGMKEWQVHAIQAGWMPAPTPRKPLTDEEISVLWDGHTVPVFDKTGINPIVFARAIERAHGIGEQHE